MFNVIFVMFSNMMGNVFVIVKRERIVATQFSLEMIYLGD